MGQGASTIANCLKCLPMQILAALLWFAAAGLGLAQDFSQSRIDLLSGSPIAGDVMRYELVLSQSGPDDIYAEVKIAAPNVVLVSFSSDCATTTLSTDPVWIIRNLRAGELRRCIVEVLTYPHSAGANAVLQADVLSGGSFHRIESSLLLASSHTGPSGLFTFTFIGLGGCTILIWALTRSPNRNRRRRRSNHLLAAALGLAFLGIFVDMARDDWAAAFNFEETQCRIIGAAFDIGIGPKNHRSSATTYGPRLALEYEAGGKRMLSSGFATQSHILIGNLSDLSEYRLNTRVPCRYDPEHPQTVLVHWSPGWAYLFAILPLGLNVLSWRTRP